MIYARFTTKKLKRPRHKVDQQQTLEYAQENIMQQTRATIRRGHKDLLPKFNLTP
jgi:hypothetical protein